MMRAEQLAEIHHRLDVALREFKNGVPDALEDLHELEHDLFQAWHDALREEARQEQAKRALRDARTERAQRELAPTEFLERSCA